MNFPDVVDLLAVAAHIRGCPAAQVVASADLEALGLTLEETREAAVDGPASAASTLLYGLVERRAFGRANRRVSLAATLYFVGCNDRELGLPGAADVDRLLDDIEGGLVSRSYVFAWVASRLRLPDVRLEPPTTPPTPNPAADPATDPAERLPLTVQSSTTPVAEEGIMFERFTDHARRTVVVAQEEARTLNHNYIGTEHILLALTNGTDSISGRVLDDLGVTRDNARKAALDIVGRGKKAPVGHIPFTPRAKKVLELALREALARGDDFIGDEHLLLGLIREGKGVAAQIIEREGGPLGDVRRKVEEVVGRTPASERSGTGMIASRVLQQRRELSRQLTEALEENESLHAENERLRALLQSHGIDPGVGGAVRAEEGGVEPEEGTSLGDVPLDVDDEDDEVDEPGDAGGPADEGDKGNQGDEGGEPGAASSR